MSEVAGKDIAALVAEGKGKLASLPAAGAAPAAGGAAAAPAAGGKAAPAPAAKKEESEEEEVSDWRGEELAHALAQSDAEPDLHARRIPKPLQWSWWILAQKVALPAMHYRLRVVHDVVRP